MPLPTQETRLRAEAVELYPDRKDPEKGRRFEEICQKLEQLHRERIKKMSDKTLAARGHAAWINHSVEHIVGDRIWEIYREAIKNRDMSLAAVRTSGEVDKIAIKPDPALRG